MTPADLDQFLKTVAANAPELRRVGVTHVELGDLAFELAAAVPEPVTATPATPDHPDDPMKDPDTFGGQVPRRRGERPPSRMTADDDATG